MGLLIFLQQFLLLNPHKSADLGEKERVYVFRGAGLVHSTKHFTMIAHAVNLAAAVALLLWSVRMIRTGVERGFLPELRRWLKDAGQNRFTAALGGLLGAMFLQSATAVSVIAAGFVNAGLLTSAAALALVLGAELGSALMAIVLLLPVQALVPVALLFGVVTFLNARTRRAKQTGRMLIGFALVLVSLGMIRSAAAPIADNDIVLAAAGYFQNDLLSAFVIGALLAWLMHSSLAAVLLYATLAVAGIVTEPVAMAMVVGANLGGAMIPYVLLWSADRPIRVFVSANLVARGIMAALALFVLDSGVLSLPMTLSDPGQRVVFLHIALNACLLLTALPFTMWLTNLAHHVIPKSADPLDDSVSALDTSVLHLPPLALACAQRELLSMGETVQAMLVPIMQTFRHWDADAAHLIELREDRVDLMHYTTKIYLSNVTGTGLTEDQSRRMVELVTIANNLEEAADRIAVNLLSLSQKMYDEGLHFSDQGLRELEEFHDQVVTNTQLALGVLTTGDAESARQLVVEKDRIRGEEQRLQRRHLERLQAGDAASVETTNIHQETLRFLKQINAAICYVAYPIAQETGDLLETRLARPAKIGGAA